ncbi:retrovirus-related pol polyprotein from transposon TNT 1-94 [Tanacetum coccineum]
MELQLTFSYMLMISCYYLMMVHTQLIRRLTEVLLDHYNTWLLLVLMFQFMHAPTQLHLQALKRELRYFKGTIHHGLFLNRKSAITLTAFSNSNWGGIKDNGRSTTAYILYLGSNNISWRSARQKSVSRSSTKAEYKALANASAEMMWVQNLLHELGISLHETPTLFCDNTGATYLCANPVYHSCMKHGASGSKLIHAFSFQDWSLRLILHLARAC